MEIQEDRDHIPCSMKYSAVLPAGSNDETPSSACSGTLKVFLHAFSLFFCELSYPVTIDH